MLHPDIIHQQINMLSVIQETDTLTLETAHHLLRHVGYHPLDLSVNLTSNRPYPRTAEHETISRATDLIILACGTLNIQWDQG